MRPVYIVLIVLGGLALCAGAIFGCFYGLVRYIRLCRSCDFDIDNTEMRISIDVQHPQDVWCAYNDTAQTKTSVYAHMDVLHKEQYLIDSRLVKVMDAPPMFTTMRAWNDSMRNIPVRRLFYKQGSNQWDKWVVVYDSSSTTLWVELAERSKG